MLSCWRGCVSCMMAISSSRAVIGHPTSKHSAPAHQPGYSGSRLCDVSKPSRSIASVTEVYGAYSTH